MGHRDLGGNRVARPRIQFSESEFIGYHVELVSLSLICILESPVGLNMEKRVVTVLGI